MVSILILLSGSTWHAFAQVTNATLSGHVEDERGAAIPAAIVTSTNLDKNQTWTVTSDEQGRYSFLYLPAGPYQLKVEQTGFRQLHRAIDSHGRPGAQCAH